MVRRDGGRRLNAKMPGGGGATRVDHSLDFIGQRDGLCKVLEARVIRHKKYSGNSLST
jgi:hypothetical protein